MKRKLPYILMGVAFVSALVSMVMGIMTGDDWVWQAICLVWIVVAYLNHRLYETITDHVQDLIEHLTDGFNENNRHV